MVLKNAALFIYHDEGEPPFLRGGGPPGCIALEGCTVEKADGELMLQFTIVVKYAFDPEVVIK